MTNIEKQADEILALQSIFDRKFHRLNENQYEILIEFDLIKPFHIQYNNEISSIEYLPPFTLIIQYHDEYPSDYPPSFILSCFYFSKFHLQNICQKLDDYQFIKDEVCVFDWIQLIQDEITNELIIDMKFQEQNNDPRALNGCSIENMRKIYQYLINYNQERVEEVFSKQFQICLICTDNLPGSDCIRLHRCGHFYCKSCLNNYVEITLNNGQFGEQLSCPQDQCKQPLLPTEVKQSLQNKQLYERYERLTLQRSLESMNDIVWCPRCQSAVVIDNINDNLGMCYQCFYTFCQKCREIYHSESMCPKDYAILQMKLQQEKERQRIQKQQEEALAQWKKAEEEKQSLIEKNLARQRYRQIAIKLSEENALLEEVLTAERMDTLDTQQCPNCHIRIEKNGGCSHMHCSQCNNDFTWQTIDKPQTSDKHSLLMDPSLNSQPIESIKEVLNKTARLVTIGQQKIDQVKEDKEEEEGDENLNNQNVKVLIDNRSILGSAVIRRVKQCPYKSCKKYNVKIGADNWMICTACMVQYCFICDRRINGTQHFEGKCQRYTTI